MTCPNPDLSRKLISYELRELSTEDEIFFEAHLLECRACYEDLKALTRVGTLIREHLDSKLAGFRRRLRRRTVMGFGAAAFAAAAALALIVCSVFSPVDKAPEAGAFVRQARAALQAGDIDRAAAAAQQARDLDPDLAEALLVLARVDLAREDRPAAIHHLQAAAGALPESPDPLRVEILGLLAETLAESGLLPAACDAYHLAAAAAADLGFAAERAGFLAWSARLRIGRMMDPVRGRQDLDEAWAAARGTTDPAAGQIVASVELGFQLLVRGDALRAQEIAEEQVRQAEAEVPLRPARLGEARGHRGLVATMASVTAPTPADREDDLRRGEEDLLAAVSLLESAGDRARLAWALGHLATVYLLHDRDAEAETVLARALAADEGSRDGYRRSLLIGNCGIRELKTGLFAEALACFEEAIGIADRIESRLLLLQLDRLRGRALLGLNRIDEARAALLSALDRVNAFYETPARARDRAEIQDLLDRIARAAPSSTSGPPPGPVLNF